MAGDGRGWGGGRGRVGQEGQEGRRPRTSSVYKRIQQDGTDRNTNTTPALTCASVVLQLRAHRVEASAGWHLDAAGAIKADLLWHACLTKDAVAQGQRHRNRFARSAPEPVTEENWQSRGRFAEEVQLCMKKLHEPGMPTGLCASSIFLPHARIACLRPQLLMPAPGCLSRKTRSAHHHPGTARLRNGRLKSELNCGSPPCR